MSAQKTEAWVGIVEDGLDVVMLVGSVIYILIVNETSFALSPDTMAKIGGVGGTLRIILRRMLKRIVEARLSKEDSG